MLCPSSVRRARLRSTPDEGLVCITASFTTSGYRIGNVLAAVRSSTVRTRKNTALTNAGMAICRSRTKQIRTIGAERSRRFVGSVVPSSITIRPRNGVSTAPTVSKTDRGNTLRTLTVRAILNGTAGRSSGNVRSVILLSNDIRATLQATWPCVAKNAVELGCPERSPVPAIQTGRVVATSRTERDGVACGNERWSATTTPVSAVRERRRNSDATLMSITSYLFGRSRNQMLTRKQTHTSSKTSHPSVSHATAKQSSGRYRKRCFDR